MCLKMLSRSHSRSRHTQMNYVTYFKLVCTRLELNPISLHLAYWGGLCKVIDLYWIDFSPKNIYLWFNFLRCWLFSTRIKTRRILHIITCKNYWKDIDKQNKRMFFFLSVGCVLFIIVSQTFLFFSTTWEKNLLPKPRSSWKTRICHFC